MTALKAPRYVAALMTLALPLTMAAKCEEDGGSSPAKACDLRESEPPHTVQGHGRLVIEAAVRAYCDPAPQSHLTVVWLERESGGEFFPVKETEQRYTAIPAGGPRGTEFAVAYRGCRPGQWRVRAKASGTGPDGKPFSFSLPAAEARVRVIKCS